MLYHRKPFFILLFLLGLQLSCDTELLEIDKLSQNTGLTPSVQLPIAQAEIQLNSYLDRLDFEIDYERDDYATIYVSDSIQRLVETSIEDIYDPTELSAEVGSTYTLSPIELEDINNDFNRISISDATQLSDGTTTVILPFESEMALGTIDAYSESYRSARFFDGLITFTLANQLPLDANVKILLYDENDQLITSSETFSIAENTTETSSIQIDGLTIPKQIKAQLEIQSDGSAQPITVDSQSQFIDTQFNLLGASVDLLELNQEKSFNYTFSTAINLDEGDDVSLAQMYLKESIMKLEFVNQIDHPIELLISSDDMTVDDQPLQLQYTVLKNNQTQIFQEDLNNTLIEFTLDPATDISQISIGYDLTLDLQPGDILEANRDLRYKALFEVVDFEYLYGNLTPTQHMVSDSTLISQKLSELYDKVNVVDPKLTFTAHNGFGIPLKFSYDAIGKRNNGSEFEFVFDNDTQLIDPAAELYEVASSEWFYDKSNSNLDELISFIPDDKLNIDATIDVNPNAVNQNFLHDESEFWIDIYAETPMHFNINNVEILDTLTINSSIDTSDLAQILEATLHFDYRSELPLEVQLRTQMIDTLSKNVFFELEPLLLNAAPVSALGEVTEPATGRMSISLTQDEITELADVNGIPFELTISTSDPETKDAKISANSTIQLQVQVEVKIDVDEY
ncbi:MAG: hypothetical protein P8H63_00175 [Flavobacteriaceae bacterium]|nr:hypothetical protein [Flavobacteriaceae bacterium]